MRGSSGSIPTIPTVGGLAQVADHSLRLDFRTGDVPFVPIRVVGRCRSQGRFEILTKIVLSNGPSPQAVEQHGEQAFGLRVVGDLAA